MKYLAVYRSLKKAIDEQAYAATGKLPHVVELASEFKVNSKTILHALRLLALEGVIRGVRSKGTFVTPQQESHVFKKPEQCGHVGLITPYYGSHAVDLAYFRNRYMGIESETMHQGRSCVLISARGKTPAEVRRELLAFQIDGIIGVELYDKSLRREIESMRLPVVFTDLTMATGNETVLSCDEQQGGALACELLVKRGHKKILCLVEAHPTTGKADPMAMTRFQGLKKAAQKHKACRIFRETIPLVYSKLESCCKDALEKWATCSGLVCSGSSIFRPIRRILQAQPEKKADAYDCIVFEEDNDPVPIHRKPVYFCRADGYAIGQTAARIVLGLEKQTPGCTLFPMSISRNMPR